MPTTYAHDLFGKEVYKRLPPDMKALLRRHGDLYRIGLHGPDILFYYMVSKNPVTQFGIEMHHEKARAFFEEGMRQVRRNNDEALFAYLLGFGCHYILDSACHPYVNKMAAEGVIPHIVLEKEFDRVLMEETGKDPDYYYPACGIVPKMEYARVIHRSGPIFCSDDKLPPLRYKALSDIPQLREPPLCKASQVQAWELLPALLLRQS